MRNDTRDSVKFSDGERIIICLLCEVLKKLPKNEDGDEPNYDYIKEAVGWGHFWSLKLRQSGCSGLLETPIDEELAWETLDIVQMWDMLEFSYKKLSKQDQELVDSKITDKVFFRGFDGNEESQQSSVLSFAMERIGIYTDFGDEESIMRDRDGLNTHFPVLEKYREMLKVFREEKGVRRLSAESIVKIMNAG